MTDYQFALEEEQTESEETAEETEDLRDAFSLESWEFWLGEEDLDYFRYPLTLPVSSVGSWGYSLELKFWDLILEWEIRTLLSATTETKGLSAALTTEIEASA